MQRRTLIKTVLGWISLGRSLVWAQHSSFPGEHSDTLKNLAVTVLPESLGQAETDRVVRQFIRWVREYRPGAEMQTGYGFTRLRYKPSSPESRYLAQMDELAFHVRTGKTMAARRAKIAESLKTANVQDLSTVPDGNHVASDLMSFYFATSEANDRAYAALVGKDQCRGLRNSRAEPAPLRTDTASDKI